MNIDECIGIIPSLCIHLRDSSSKNGMELNKETMLPPIYRLSGSCSFHSYKSLEKTKSTDKSKEDKKEEKETEEEEICKRHDAEFVRFVCDRIAISPSSVLDFELFLYDLNVGSSIHPSIYPLFIHSSIHPFIHSSIHPFIHSSIHPFILTGRRHALPE